MHLTSKPGLKVIFSRPESGFSADQKKAEEYLQPGSVYTIKSINKGAFYSTLTLQEVPGQQFNPVQFEDLDKTPG